MTLPFLAKTLPLTPLNWHCLAWAVGDAARPSSYQIKVNVDLHDLQLEHLNGRHSGEIDVSFSLEGSGTARTKTLKIDIPNESFASLLENGIDTVESTDTLLRDGTGQSQYMRVVVQDRATGAAGSIRIPLRKR